MTTGISQAWMSLRDANGVELTARILVPYTIQNPPGTLVVLQVIASGEPIEMAMFDSPSAGMLLWTVPSSNPLHRQLTAGQQFPLTISGGF